MEAITRRKIFIEGLMIGWMAWAVMFLLTYVFPAQHLPPPPRPGQPPTTWFDIFVIAAASHFMYVKGWLMLRRSRRVTWLGLSLVLVNLSFAVIYQFGIAYMLWPHLLTNEHLRRGLRVEILLCTLFCVVMLGATKDPSREVLNVPIAPREDTKP